MDSGVRSPKRSQTARCGALAVWHARIPTSLLLIVLALLPFVVFWTEALGQCVFYHHDLQYYFFPYHKVVADIAARGDWPLWNPYAFSGIPLLGDGQTAMWYPPNWVFAVLPPIHALTVAVLLQFSIAGVGAFAYLRSIQLSRLAACVGALTFMFNGFLVARVVHLSIMAGAALIPAVFWAIERLVQRPHARHFAVAAVLVCVQALTGHPQIPVYTAVALGVYLIVVCWLRWRHQPQSAARWRIWTPLLLVPAVYGVGYALAAIQLVPWIEFAAQSPRAASVTYEFITSNSIRGWDWLLFLFPYGYGGLRTSFLQSAPPWDLPVYLWERLGYIGLLPLALALVGLADLRHVPSGAVSRPATTTAALAPTRLQHERLWALTMVLVVMVLFAAGSSTPFGYVIYALPVVGLLRDVARAVALVCFVIACLAAFGVDRLRRQRSAQRPAWAPAVAAVLLLGLVGGALLVGSRVSAAASTIDPRNVPMYVVLLRRGLRIDQASAYMPLLFALASAAVLWWLRYGITARSAAVLIGVIALDLLGFASTFNPVTDPATFANVPSSVAFLRQDPAMFRTATFIENDRLPPTVAQQQLAISWALPYGIEDVNGFNSLQPRRYTDFLFGPDVADVSYGFLIDPTLLQPSNRLLSMLNVRYAVVQPDVQPRLAEVLVPPEARTPYTPEFAQPRWTRVFADEHVSIYRNPFTLDRAYFVDQVSAVADPRAILALIKQPGFDPTRQAFVEGAAPLIAQTPQSSSAASVTTTRVSPNELRIDTQTATERFLVVSEMWFPGWHAEIDGQNVPIYRTNYLFRGLRVPAGTHTIRMYYRPLSAIVGAAVTASTAGALLGGLGIARWRRRRSG